MEHTEKLTFDSFLRFAAAHCKHSKSELPQSKYESAVPVIQNREDNRPQRSEARQTSGLGKVQVLHKGDRHPYDLEMDISSRSSQKMGEPAPVVWCASINVICAEMYCTEHYVHIRPYY